MQNSVNHYPFLKIYIEMLIVAPVLIFMRTYSNLRFVTPFA